MTCKGGKIFNFTIFTILWITLSHQYILKKPKIIKTNLKSTDLILFWHTLQCTLWCHFRCTLWCHFRCTFCTNFGVTFGAAFSPSELELLDEFSKRLEVLVVLSLSFLCVPPFLNHKLQEYPASFHAPWQFVLFSPFFHFSNFKPLNWLRTVQYSDLLKNIEASAASRVHCHAYGFAMLCLTPNKYMKILKCFSFGFICN